MFFDAEQPAGFECLGETRTCQRIADEVAASGETDIVVNAGIFGTCDLLGLGAEAELWGCPKASTTLCVWTPSGFLTNAPHAVAGVAT